MGLMSHPPFKKFASAHVLVIGDVMLDKYLEGHSDRISPEAPVPVFKSVSERCVLGGAANTAANIASLGGKVSLIGLVGKDANAKQLSNLCKNQGIDFIPYIWNAPTITKTRIVGNMQQMLRIDNEESASYDDQKNLLASAKDILKKCQVLLFSDYNKGCLSSDFCQSLIAHCKKNHIHVIVDPKPCNIHFFSGCDYLTPNWKEAREIAGQHPKGKSDSDLLSVASAIHQLTSASVIMTLGADGLFFAPKNSLRTLRMPTVAKEVYDVSGAGDTFIATFSLCKASGCDDVLSLQLANQASGIVVGKHGTSLVYPSDFVEATTQHPKLITSREELKTLSTHHKSQGKTIVSINGSFDLVHAGHLYFLNEAKKQGDILVVGLNTDKSIQKYKSKDRPIINQNDRAQILLALRMIDYVYLFDETDPRKFISDLKPHIHVNGEEYGTNCIESQTVTKIGGKLHLVKRLPGLSTSDIIQKILKIHS